MRCGGDIETVQESSSEETSWRKLTCRMERGKRELRRSEGVDS